MKENLAGRGEGLAGLREIHSRLNAFVHWLDLQTRSTSDVRWGTVADKLAPIVNDLQIALEAAARLPAERVLDEQPFFFAIETAGGDWHDGESSIFGDRVEAQGRVDDLNEELPEAEWYRVVPLYRALATPSPQAPVHLFDCKCLDCLTGLPAKEPASRVQQSPAPECPVKGISCDAPCKDYPQCGSPRKVGEDGPDLIRRCMARNSETGQCELREGHAGKHLGGYLMWGPSSAPVGEQKQEEVV